MVSGEADFATILVYDVSRWGRFQDADESAHYEFICRQAGIRIEYCAEQFENDGSLLSTIAKTLKRVQAADYSRELSVKVFAGQRRLCEMGFALGGGVGYGLRRMLVDDHGVAKCELAPRQWKSIATDRVILIPGPPAEVETVRRIFLMFARERMSEGKIARTLNTEGIVGPRGNRWCHQTINYLLRSEKYIGNLVWNRQSFKLKKIHVRNKPESWLRVERAWKAIIDRPLYDAVQARFRARAQYTCGGRPKDLSDEDMLAGLRQLLTERGRLSRQIIAGAARLPSCGMEQDAGSIERDGFGNAVEEFLRSQEWQPCNANDGGAFGLDFAIENPDTGLSVIGIECDAPRHRILESARAREVWRPRVMRRAVRRVHRVSSYGWLHNGEAERTSLRSAVEKAFSSEGGRHERSQGLSRRSQGRARRPLRGESEVVDIAISQFRAFDSIAYFALPAIAGS